MTSKLPAVLLRYQAKLIQLVAKHKVVFCEKSRRIGMTWGIGADAVLTAAASRKAGGMKVFYIGFNLDMTREFIDVCAMWAKNFKYAAQEVEEFIFKDDNDKEIQAFRIKFDSGYEIVALTSRPRSLRGRQGYVIIDEAAFHDDLKELMKAALALLIWGGKVLVISTHDGASNPFNEYILDARAKKNNYAILRVDLDDALKDGLYERICLTTGKTYSLAAEREWRDELIKFYGDGADEELFCIPRLSSGTWLTTALIESRMQEGIPILRLEMPDAFAMQPEEVRNREVEDWCKEKLKPLLDALDPNLRSTIGGDAGRTGDLTVFWPFVIERNLVRHTPFVVELRNMPFRQQLQILWYIMDRLPRFYSGAADARGLGQQMAEETAQRYGVGRFQQIMTSRSWYLEAFPPYKGALEDATIILPRDADIKDDHRAATVEGGIPQIRDKRTTGKDGGKRHGDSLIAAVMAYWSSRQDVEEYDYTPAFGGQRSKGTNLDIDDDEDEAKRSFAFGNNEGAW